MNHSLHSLAYIFSIILFVFILRSCILKLLPNKKRYAIGVILTIYLILGGLAFISHDSEIEHHIVLSIFLYLYFEKSFLLKHKKTKEASHSYNTNYHKQEQPKPFIYKKVLKHLL